MTNRTALAVTLIVVASGRQPSGPRATPCELLGEMWPMCDDVGSHIDFLIFDSAISERTGPVREMMSEDELVAFDKLPSKLKVYRGCYWVAR